jgi:hypothetical protein
MHPYLIALATYQQARHQLDVQQARKQCARSWLRTQQSQARQQFPNQRPEDEQQRQEHCKEALASMHCAIEAVDVAKHEYELAWLGVQVEEFLENVG